MARSFFGIVGGLAWAPLLWAAPALAEPSNEAIRMARRRFLEGVAAVDAGNFEAARIAFQQAYALKPHPTTLRNLGQAELRTGRNLEAARHLASFLRDTSFGTQAEREATRKSLAQAEAHVAKMTFEVNVDGAEITVDGEPAGRSPLSDPFYAEPGERVIRIQRSGFEAYETRQLLEMGRTTQLKIALVQTRAATPAASVSRVTGSLLPPSDLQEESYGGVGPPPPGLVPRDSGIAPRTIVLVTTGTLAVASAGVWLGFGLHGASLQNEADDLRVRIDREHPIAQCRLGEPPCDELRDVSDRRAAANRTALVGAVATGISGAAFAATLFLWPGRSAPSLSIAPAWSTARTGLDIVGIF